MSQASVSSFFARTARMDSHAIARALVSGLGPTLVAAMTGAKDRKLPTKWAKSDGPRPSPMFLHRLQYGYRAWSAIVEAEGDHVARAWFIGGNPVLGENTPLSAIRDDRGADVMQAVQAFLSGEPDV